MSRSHWLFPSFLALVGCSILADLGKSGDDPTGTTTGVAAETACGDDADNDGDGATDCGDPDCVTSAACNGGEDGDADTDADTDADADSDTDADADADTDADADADGEVAYSGATVGLIEIDGKVMLECVGEFSLVIDWDREEGSGYADCTLDGQVAVARGEVVGTIDRGQFAGLWLAEMFDSTTLDLDLEGPADSSSVFLTFLMEGDRDVFAGQMEGDAD